MAVLQKQTAEAALVRSSGEDSALPALRDAPDSDLFDPCHDAAPASSQTSASAYLNTVSTMLVQFKHEALQLCRKVWESTEKQFEEALAGGTSCCVSPHPTGSHGSPSRADVETGALRIDTRSIAEPPARLLVLPTESSASPAMSSGSQSFGTSAVSAPLISSTRSLGRSALLPQRWASISPLPVVRITFLLRCFVRPRSCLCQLCVSLARAGT